MEFSRNKITFLKDVPSNIKVDLTSGWRHVFFEDAVLIEISSFIKSIKDDKIYLIIPLFMCSKSLSNPTLKLSKPFLVDNKSNHVLIINFIWDQWKLSGFELKPDSVINFSFEFKRVWLKLK